jgi:hypothetical protein
MKKIRLNWSYQIDSPTKKWIINNSDFDFSISIDRTDPSDFLILYESKAILPHVYNYALKNSSKYRMIFTHDESICDNRRFFKIPPFFSQWIHGEDVKIHDKNSLISMIASTKDMCEGHRYRNEVADSFSQKVDLYGMGRKNSLENKVDGLKGYMFSIAMENACYDTYYTEKLLDCFLTGTIPIYWGSRKISDHFDINGIIFLDDFDISSLNQDLYLSKMESIRRNFEIARSLNFTSGDMIDHVINIIENGK